MSEHKHKYRARGRCGRVVELPCNWIKDGRCGDDTKVCFVQRIDEVWE
jgi:hypothetical protein